MEEAFGLWLFLQEIVFLLIGKQVESPINRFISDAVSYTHLTLPTKSKV